MKFSKNEFKRIINKKCKNAAFNFLLKEKSNKKKGKQFKYDEFKIQNYLRSDSGICSQDAKRIFSLRSHSLDVAENYSKKYILNECIKKCDQAHDSQFHLYMCPRLQQQNIISDNNIIEYEQIYSSNVKNQLHIMKMIYAAYEQRCKIMSSSENVEDPAGYQPFTGVGNQGVKTGQN